MMEDDDERRQRTRKTMSLRCQARCRNLMRVM
jgi:hypothetical protein